MHRETGATVVIGADALKARVCPHTVNRLLVVMGVEIDRLSKAVWHRKARVDGWELATFVVELLSRKFSRC